MLVAAGRVGAKLGTFIYLLLLARHEIVVLRDRHDAAYMWRTGMVASAVCSLGALSAYTLARGSIVRKVGVGVGMGYAGAAIGVPVGGVMLGWHRIDRTDHFLSAVGVGTVGAAYLAAFGMPLFQ